MKCSLSNTISGSFLPSKHNTLAHLSLLYSKVQSSKCWKPPGRKAIGASRERRRMVRAPVFQKLGLTQGLPQEWFQVPAGTIILPLLPKRGQSRGDASMAKPPRGEKLNSPVRAFTQPASSTKCGSFPQHPSFSLPDAPQAEAPRPSSCQVSSSRPGCAQQNRPRRVPGPRGWEKEEEEETGGGGTRLGSGAPGASPGKINAFIRPTASRLAGRHPRKQSLPGTRFTRGSPQEIAGQTGLQRPRTGGPCAPG